MSTVILAHDTFHRVTDVEGNLYVEVERERGEHHSTVRSAALRFARDVLGERAVIGAYVGPVYYRRSDGHPATAARFTVVLPEPRS